MEHNIDGKTVLRTEFIESEDSEELIIYFTDETKLTIAGEWWNTGGAGLEIRYHG